MMRAHAQLAELNGKKYLKSAVDKLPSFYGPNNKTLVLAPDAMMQQLVPAAKQPKTGALLDRTQEVPAGSDVYLAVNLVPLLPLLQMGMLNPQVAGKIPPDAKPFVDALNGIAAAELTLNVTNPGPTSLVLHCNDDNAASTVENLSQQALQKFRAGPQQTSEQPAEPAADNPLATGMPRYRERISQVFQPVRNGSTVTILHLDGQDPVQRQLVVTTIAMAPVAILPAIQAARNAAMKAQPGAGPPGAPTGAPPTGEPGASAPPATPASNEPERR
jgi:hypothetical protein